jgi:hypothetical protein
MDDKECSYYPHCPVSFPQKGNNYRNKNSKKDILKECQTYVFTFLTLQTWKGFCISDKTLACYTLATSLG